MKLNNVIKITDDCEIYYDKERGWKQGKGQPKWHKVLVDRWIDMWTRCNNPNDWRYESYKDCKIDERYRTFSNYLNDIMQLDNFDKLCENPSKWHIDKDKIDPNNRCYYFEHLSIITNSDNSKERMSRKGSPMKNPDYAKKNGDSHKKSIKAININSGEVLYFDSQVDAAEELGILQGSISNCLYGRAKSYKGYKWEFLDEKNSRK